MSGLSIYSAAETVPLPKAPAVFGISRSAERVNDNETADLIV
jgi:hypothetical protein